MREIKFRAWTNETCGRHPVRKMWSWEELLADIETEIAFTKTVFGLGLAGKSPVLMQHTGLKDKNGKEIYEGDVVENNGHHWTVGFHDGSFMLEIGKEKNRWHIIGENTHCEVVGNQYEHPDLLT